MCIRDRLFHGHGRGAVLLEHLHDALALCQTRLGISVQIRAELRKGLQLAVLGVDQLQGAGHFLHGLDPVSYTHLITGKKIDLATKIDPSVLGGIRLDIEGTELDGTVQNRLATLRRNIAAATRCV